MRTQSEIGLIRLIGRNTTAYGFILLNVIVNNVASHTTLVLTSTRTFKFTLPSHLISLTASSQEPDQSGAECPAL